MPYKQEIPIRKKYRCQCGKIVREIDCDEPQEYCPYCGRLLCEKENPNDIMKQNSILS